MSLGLDVLDHHDRGRLDEVVRLAIVAQQGRAEGASDPRPVLCAPGIGFIVSGEADSEDDYPEILEHIDRDETAGIDWIAANDVKTVSLRHAPELEPALRGVTNAFAPWNRKSSPAPA